MSTQPLSNYFEAPARPGQVSLYCLPYAGGGTSLYRTWRRGLPHIDVQPVQLPGRDTRMSESPRVDVGELAQAIHQRTSGPYAIYGHSMGGWVAFEVIKELRRLGAPAPRRLYVGAARPPHLDPRLPKKREFTDQELVDALIQFGGTPTDVLELPELQELFLPVFRTDFEWMAAYRFIPSEPIDVPVIALLGRDDRATSFAEMLGWRRHTAASVQIRELPGGHFFHTDDPTEVLAILSADLLRICQDDGSRTPADSVQKTP